VGVACSGCVEGGIRVKREQLSPEWQWRFVYLGIAICALTSVLGWLFSNRWLLIILEENTFFIYLTGLLVSLILLLIVRFGYPVREGGNIQR
jgi:hypothetical protein